MLASLNFSLSGPHWLQIHRELPASVFWVLGLKASTTILVASSKLVDDLES